MKRTTLQFTGERMIPELNKDHAFYYEHLNRYFLATQFSKDKIVLDCACGTGYGSFIISKYGSAKNVISLDISPESISYARKKYDLKNISYRQDDVQTLKTIPSNSIDLIVSFETIEHIHRPSLAIKQFKRVLKNNGILIVSTPNTDNYSEDNRFHLQELNLSQFSTLLKKNFKNVRILGQKYLLSQQVFSLEKEKDISFNDDRLVTSGCLNYISKSSLNNSEYFIALCSNFLLPKFIPQQMSVDHVDNLDLISGIIPIEKNISSLNHQLEDARQQLREIKNSKFFKLWSLYCRLKKIFSKDEI